MAGSPNVLVRGGTLVPLVQRKVWEDGDLLVEGGAIARMGDVGETFDAEVLDARGCLVVPGFVQCHVHVVQSLARNHAEGLSLLDWLRGRIWPYEAALAEEDVRAAARLGIAELLATGTTCAVDMGTTSHHGQVFEAAAELGIRFASGMCLMDEGEGVPQALLQDPHEALAESERLGQRWHGWDGDRLHYAVAPRFVLSCSDELLGSAAELARRHGWLLHTHASENAGECEAVRNAKGAGNVAYLARLGITGPDTVLAHCVHLDDEEHALLARDGTGVAHCPGANLKLASGIADLPRLLADGVRTGLGADGPPCNNRLSIFREMSLAGTLHNLRYGAGAVDPWTVLELATWRGARVAGFDNLGRLAPGWRADVVVLDGGTWGMLPAADPATMIVHGGGAASVRHVVVNGRVVVRDGVLQTGDAREIRVQAQDRASVLEHRLEW